MSTQLAERDDLVRERNLYKGKYRALLKLIIKIRGKLVQVTDHIDDEGDRVYFGSSNHADDLKELYHEMMGWIWDATDETNRMKSDPYADIRKQRARAKVAENRVAHALDVLIRHGQIDGAHHKLWVIDQAVRALTGEDYARVIAEAKEGEDGPETYGWDEGIAP